MAKTSKPKLDRTPHEWCHACQKPVWSMALHMFSCPKMHGELPSEELAAWDRIEKATQDLADSRL